MARDLTLAAVEPLLEAMRRHIRSYEPGTLVGSELNVAHHLRELDGEIWAPWCAPGDHAANLATEFADLVEMVEASGTHVVVPLKPTPEMSDAAFEMETDGHSLRTLCEAAYREMLAARPRQASDAQQ